MPGQRLLAASQASDSATFAQRLPSQASSRRERIVAGFAVVVLHLFVAAMLILGMQSRHNVRAIGSALLPGEVEISVRSERVSKPAAPMASSTHALSSPNSQAAKPTPTAKREATSGPIIGIQTNQGTDEREGAHSGAMQLENTTPATVDATSGAAGSDYGRKLLRHIEENKRYPTNGVAERPSGVVRVLFTVTRNGAVSGVWVQSGSGSPALDHEAVATLLRAQPLPPIPADLPAPLNFSFDMEFSPPSVVLPQ